MRDILQQMQMVIASGSRGAVAAVIRCKGSTPQSPGARLLLTHDGCFVGTVGGGAIEEVVKAALRECVRSGKSTVVQKHLGRDLGMCCGGSMEVFVEPVEAAPRLRIFGAGHVGQATAQSARLVGFQVTVVDDREELCTEDRFPGCDTFVGDPEESLDSSPPTDAEFLLIVTHDHQLDEKVLRLCVERPHRYIGLIGSERKVRKICQRLSHRGINADLARVYAPVGTDIGAVTPEEIAVSITSELIALRRGRAVRHMKLSNLVTQTKDQEKGLLS